MLSFFKRKTYPKYFKKYLNSFKNKKPKSINKTRFVVFDTETTGLDTNTDRILSIGAIAINNGIIDVADSFEIYLKQDQFNADTVEIHGILKEGNIEKISEEKAIEHFINYLKNAVLIAHHAAFDVKMINSILKRMNLQKLKNKSIDTGILYKKLEGKQNDHFSLDKLCEEFNIPLHDRHTASGDAYITAILFLKIISKLKQQRLLHYSDLFRTNNSKGLL
ncbi:DNA polymerase-3 subunit epsilon [Lutibacter oricola]|uniref:DNA polymerase-3 subunit epsilon n=1 Tax=Lutibacter oricola TaxID=762486 RepID=A0A1H3FJD5_9FLAO|nr:3'-5' exonuclease [Lutibacter oricola]SDX91040.1 DNA polymerase-3 subunit epsilon [Lutibacter oricola]